MSITPTELAWYLAVETEYGLRQLVARIWKTDNDSYAHNDYADFRVVAWLDHEHEHPWATKYGFQGHDVIELRQAEFMVKTLRKLQRGMDKADTEQGYLQDGNYSGHLFRVARILGIKTYYVASTPQQRAVTGQRWQREDATGVQHHIQSVQRQYCKASTSA